MTWPKSWAEVGEVVYWTAALTCITQILLYVIMHRPRITDP